MDFAFGIFVSFFSKASDTFQRGCEEAKAFPFFSLNHPSDKYLNIQNRCCSAEISETQRIIFRFQCANSTIQCNSIYFKHDIVFDVVYLNDVCLYVVELLTRQILPQICVSVDLFHQIKSILKARKGLDLRG